MTTHLLAIGAAFASAATFGTSTSLQHLVSSGLTETRPAHLLARLVRTPVWVTGMLLSVAAFALHAVALAAGPLVLVQPVIVTGVVFAVLIRSALDRRLPPGGEVAWACVTWAGLAAFLIGTGSPSRAEHPLTPAAPAVALVLVLAALGGLLARRRPARSTTKGLLLGAVSGVLLGLVAVLLKLSLGAAATGPIGFATTWAPWVMVACGGCAVLVNQRAYQTTRLSVSMPLLNIVDMLVALAFAVVVFGETPRFDGVHALAEAAGLLAMGVGVFGLARMAEPDPVLDAGLAPPAAGPPQLDDRELDKEFDRELEGSLR